MEGLGSATAPGDGKGGMMTVAANVLATLPDVSAPDPSPREDPGPIPPEETGREARERRGRERKTTGERLDEPLS